MTHDQAVGSVIISLVVGLILIVVGAVLQPLLKRLWERANAPSPLTPQTSGQLYANRIVWKTELERLNYLSKHEKDLFLRLFQLCMATLLLSVLGFSIGVIHLLLIQGAPVSFFLLLQLTVFIMAGLIGIIALAEASKLSDKKIEATKNAAQKRIDEIDRQLNPPA